MIKKNRIYFMLSVLALAVASCQVVPEVEFTVPSDTVTIGPDGGVRTVSVKSPSSWIATTQAPWITLSPANGNASSECSVIIDSTLYDHSREAYVQFKLADGSQYKEFKVEQDGYPYSITLEKATVEIPEYADYADRSFDVAVKSNVDFDVVIPDNVTWIASKKDKPDFDRGIRPRNVLVHFDWKVNSRPSKNEVEIVFRPKGDKELAKQDKLTVIQGAAPEIEAGTVKGDSLALLAICRVMNLWREWDTFEKMENWDGVEVWKEGKDKGRVRKASFFLFGTKEELPYEVSYLTAAEELYFYSNENSFLLNLSTGSHICELERLRKLTIGAYGLTKLDDNFSKLKNLEYLDLSGNNFEEVPPILSKENFPKLTALIMNANQRNVIGNLEINYKENSGGLVNECPLREDGTREFPRRLLKWNTLDTLRLSVNYLQGTIPDLMNDPDFPKWTAEEVNACDTLPAKLIGLPKVLPETDFFAINLNRLHGELPEWLLYHPKLDLWYPFQLIFLQEGKDMEGNTAGFTNEPANLNYYYEHYTNKKYNPNN
ncbi:MAG: BACON domain-containing protein [Candidatus Cryptobacteroides sp.]